MMKLETNDSTIVNAVLRSLVEIKNEISLNASLYTCRELELIMERCKDIENTIQMNIDAQNYFDEAYMSC